MYVCTWVDRYISCVTVVLILIILVLYSDYLMCLFFILLFCCCSTRIPHQELTWIHLLISFCGLFCLFLSRFRSCSSRMSVPSTWRTVCNGSIGSCEAGWTSCRGAARGPGTTAWALWCPPRGQTLTGVRGPSSVPLWFECFLRQMFCFCIGLTRSKSWVDLNFGCYTFISAVACYSTSWSLWFSCCRRRGGWCGKHCFWMRVLRWTQYYTHWCWPLLLQLG